MWEIHVYDDGEWQPIRIFGEPIRFGSRKYAEEYGWAIIRGSSSIPHRLPIAKPVKVKK